MNVSNHWKPITLALGLVVAVAAVNWIAQPSELGPHSAEAEASLTLPGNPIPGQSYKILHVMSYHSPWKWTQDQWGGFQQALSDLDVDYQVVEMDTKRHGSEAWKKRMAMQAAELIDRWQPDLVFTSDDDAQSYLTQQWLNTETPFVFSGVNASPQVYGFLEAHNVTGVLERMHFIQSVNLLKELAPEVQRIALITDRGTMWPHIIERFKAQESELQGVEVVAYDVLDTYADYQNKVLEYQNSIDALGFLGIFEYHDVNGENVPMETLMQWTVENSDLPDFAFWRDRVDKGTLCAVTVSGRDQGQTAGQLARDILVDHRTPNSLPMVQTSKGIPVVNLGRARKLGIKPQSNTFLTAEFVKDLP